MSQKIDKPVYVITEGSTDEKVIKNIFNKQIDHLYIQQKPEKDKSDKPRGIDAIPSDLNAFYNSIQLDIHDKVLKKLCIIVDADKNSGQTFQKIKKFIADKNNNVINKLSVPSKPNEFVISDHFKIGIFIFPNNMDEGCLETLMLDSAKHAHIRQSTATCCDDVIKYYEQQNIQISIGKKHKLHYDLYSRATSLEYDFTLTKAFEHSFDYTDPIFNNLKTFLSV